MANGKVKPGISTLKLGNDIPPPPLPSRPKYTFDFTPNSNPRGALDVDITKRIEVIANILKAVIAAVEVGIEMRAGDNRLLL